MNHVFHIWEDNGEIELLVIEACFSVKWIHLLQNNVNTLRTVRVI